MKTLQFELYMYGRVEVELKFCFVPSNFPCTMNFLITLNNGIIALGIYNLHVLVFALSDIPWLTFKYMYIINPPLIQIICLLTNQSIIDSIYIYMYLSIHPSI